MEKTYSEDDKICFYNIHEEMRLLGEYLADCNSRKYSLFKLSLAVFSVVVTALIAIYKLYAADNGVSLESPFNYIFGAILIFIGLINIAIIKELLSIHASRLITFRQLNCLRHALDSIKYKKFMGAYPENLESLRDPTTPYWHAIGKHRKLPLNNDGLIQSERGIFRSPDKFMILILTLISSLVIFSPLIYVASSPRASFFDGIYSAVIGLLFLAGIFAQFKDSRKRLNAQLKSGIYANMDRSNVPPVS